jgi:diamine N-acetyltransferase
MEDVSLPGNETEKSKVHLQNYLEINANLENVPCSDNEQESKDLDLNDLRDDIDIKETRQVEMPTTSAKLQTWNDLYQNPIPIQPIVLESTVIDPLKSYIRHAEALCRDMDRIRQDLLFANTEFTELQNLLSIEKFEMETKKRHNCTYTGTGSSGSGGGGSPTGKSSSVHKKRLQALQKQQSTASNNINININTNTSLGVEGDAGAGAGEIKDGIIYYRKMKVSDIEQVTEFAKISFRETFFEPCGYTEKDLNDYFNDTYQPENWLNLLNNKKRFLLIAYTKNSIDPLTHQYIRGKIKGYSCVGGPTDLPVDITEKEREKCGDLLRCYIDTSVFGTNVAKNLVHLSLKWLLKRFSGDVYIGVWSENYRAQNFYKKFGAKIIKEYFYPVGDTNDLEYVMRVDRVDVESYMASLMLTQEQIQEQEHKEKEIQARLRIPMNFNSGLVSVLAQYNRLDMTSSVGAGAGIGVAVDDHNNIIEVEMDDSDNSTISSTSSSSSASLISNLNESKIQDRDQNGKLNREGEDEYKNPMQAIIKFEKIKLRPILQRLAKLKWETFAQDYQILDEKRQFEQEQEQEHIIGFINFNYFAPKTGGNHSNHSNNVSCNGQPQPHHALFLEHLGMFCNGLLLGAKITELRCQWKDSSSVYAKVIDFMKYSGRYTDHSGISVNDLIMNARTRYSINAVSASTGPVPPYTVCTPRDISIDCNFDIARVRVWCANTLFSAGEFKKSEIMANVALQTLALGRGTNINCSTSGYSPTRFNAFDTCHIDNKKESIDNVIRNITPLKSSISVADIPGNVYSNLYGIQRNRNRERERYHEEYEQASALVRYFSESNFKHKFHYPGKEFSPSYAA